jgi:apolipoprotein N-acyltransferase
MPAKISALNPRLLQLSFTKCRRSLIAAGSGLLAGLAVEPIGAWYLAWIALVPLWMMVVRERRSILPSLLWGMGFHGVALFWITGIHPMTWMGVPWLTSFSIATVAILFFALWGATVVTLWGAIFGWICQRFHPPALVRVVVGTAIWCGLEYLWSQTDLWWSTLALTQTPNNLPILHLGQLSGGMTVTAIILAVNGLIAEAIIASPELGKESRIRLASPLLISEKMVGSAHPTNIAGSLLEPKIRPAPLLSPWEKRSAPVGFPDHGSRVREGLGDEGSPRSPKINQKTLAIAAITLFFTGHLGGYILSQAPLDPKPADALKIGIIQGNIPNEIKLYANGKQKAIEGYTTGYLQLATENVDAILTPEGALPYMPAEIKRSSLYQAVLDKGVPIWLGAFGDAGNDYTNSIHAIDKAGNFISQYDKYKLVPLGEYIPFKEIIGQWVKRLSPIEATLLKGSEQQEFFAFPGIRAAIGICYESAFGNHFRQQAQKGEFLLTASNNAHYAESMPAQHHAMDVMRSIETSRWAVRATNTGYSAIVDPHGHTLWKSKLNEFATHSHQIYRRRNQTLYVQWGDWLTPLLIISSVILLAIYRAPHSSSSGASGSADAEQTNL